MSKLTNNINATQSLNLLDQLIEDTQLLEKFKN